MRTDQCKITMTCTCSSLTASSHNPCSSNGTIPLILDSCNRLTSSRCKRSLSQGSSFLWMTSSPQAWQRCQTRWKVSGWTRDPCSLLMPKIQSLLLKDNKKPRPKSSNSTSNLKSWSHLTPTPWSGSWRKTTRMKDIRTTNEIEINQVNRINLPHSY